LDLRLDRREHVEEAFLARGGPDLTHRGAHGAAFEVFREPVNLRACLGRWTAKDEHLLRLAGVEEVGRMRAST
jgi:hypothetical protein